MRLLFSVFLAAALTIAASGQSIAESHIAAHVPDREAFVSLLKRDAAAYLATVVGKSVKVEFELLREAPTQSGVAYPKFYAWVRAYSDAEVVTEGAMRLAAIEKKRFEVTDYLSSSEIRSAPARIEAVFPRALLKKIRAKAGVK
jgi:hypothetical protein